MLLLLLSDQVVIVTLAEKFLLIKPEKKAQRIYKKPYLFFFGLFACLVIIVKG